MSFSLSDSNSSLAMLLGADAISGRTSKHGSGGGGYTF